TRAFDLPERRCFRRSDQSTFRSHQNTNSRSNILESPELRADHSARQHGRIAGGACERDWSIPNRRMEKGTKHSNGSQRLVLGTGSRCEGSNLFAESNSGTFYARFDFREMQTRPMQF